MHSVVITKNKIVNINCFDNDMLITLISPLFKYYPLIESTNKKLFLKNKMLKLEEFKDKRFKISKYLNMLKNLSPYKQILFMILNNIAQKKYLSKEIKYNQIIDFVMNNLKKYNKNVKFKSLKERIKFIDYIESQYDK